MGPSRVCNFVTSVLHKEFKYTHVTSVENNGTEIVLSYEVPCKPLTLDTILVNQLEDGNYGFSICNLIKRPPARRKAVFASLGPK